MKKLFYILSFVIAAATMSSCNDYLDVMPDNRTEINTLEKVKSLLVSAYPSKEYASFLDVRCDGVIDHGSCMDGSQQSISFEAIRVGFLWEEYPSIESDIDAEAYWSACYEAIASANHALEAIESLTPEEKAQAGPYKAEALLSRAYAHFQLLTLFSNYFDEANRSTNPGIPYVTEPETVINKQYERGTVASTIEKIKADYDEALKTVGTSSDFEQPKFHFGIEAAQMFGVRIALYERRYSDVIALVKDIIPEPSNIATYTLTSTGTQFTIPRTTDLAYIFCGSKLYDWYYAAKNLSGSTALELNWSKASNPNIILMSEPYSLLNRIALSTYYVRYAMSAKEFSAAAGNNATGYNWYFPSYGFSASRDTDPSFIPKIYEDFHVTNISANTGQPYVRFPLFRLEEALLARAEAYAMTGEYEKAMWDLAMFSQNRINASYPNFWWSKERVLDYYYNSGNYDTENFYVDNEFNAGRFTTAKGTEEGNLQRGLLMAVIDARRAEYIYEGMRYFDILRWNIPVTHKKSTGEKSTLTPDDDRRVIQIPETASLSGVEKNPYSNVNPWM